jgi:hypothetical protein
MNKPNTFRINTGVLFYALNRNRKNKGLMEIDNPLIASKLGILFALKTNSYINFRDESVKLSDEQLFALQDILEQHFNVEMTEEFQTQAVTQDSQAIENRPYQSSPSYESQGLFHKIRGFLKIKPKIQENPA